MFPPELERDAFRASNGEFGWSRSQIATVVEVLRSQGIGILGGELWWVRDESTDWVGTIPQRHGPPGGYHWETKRELGEPWLHFIDRGASDAVAAAKRWPTPGDLPSDLPGRILYNLTWVSEAEFEKLSTRTVFIDSYISGYPIHERAASEHRNRTLAPGVPTAGGDSSPHRQ